MKWLALLLAAMPALAQNASVKGSVVDVVTKAPIAGAVLKLYQGQHAARSVNADAQGAFQFTGLADGVYRLKAQHDGHMPLAADHPAAQPFVLSTANPTVQLAAQLVPLAQLQGTVLYPNREPINRIIVGLRRPWSTHFVQRAETSAKGTFHFSRLEPGSWVLAAMPGARHQSADPSKDAKPIPPPDSEDGERQAWVNTYYPQTTVAAVAERIILSPGSTREGICLTLRTMPMRKLAGMVVDEAGEPVAKAMVNLSHVEGLGGALLTTDDHGRFAFEAGVDGPWQIYAQRKKGEQVLKGHADLRVSRADATDIKVRVTAPFVVTGQVEREEPRDKAGNRKVTAVYLLPQSSQSELQTEAFHQQDGSFVLPNVYPGRYRILPAGFVPGYYVASTWYGDQEVTTRAFDIVGPLSKIRVVYRAGAASVRGTVENGEGATVLLLPQDEALRDSDQHIRIGKCDATGRFAIDSLRPGAYFALAVDRVIKDALEDAEFARRLTARAVRVDLRHGEATTLELKAIVWPEY